MGPTAEIKQKISIEARVFRAKKAPRFIPEKIWSAIAKRRFPGTGRWENLGEVASTDKGTVTFQK